MAIKQFFAEEEGLILPQEVCRQIIRRKSKPAKPKTIDRAGTPEEWRKILTHMTLEGRSLFLFLLSSATRISEALSVRVSDLDLESNPPRCYLRKVKGDYAERIAFSFAIFTKLNHRRTFRRSLILILLTVPLFNSLLVPLFIPEAMTHKMYYGFSAISCAALGLFGMSVALLLSFDQKDLLSSYISIIFLSSSFFSLIYSQILLGAILLLLALLTLSIIVWRNAKFRERTRRMYSAILLLLLYLLFHLFFFPVNPISGGFLINIYAHFLGIVLGLSIPFFLVMHEKSPQ
ncbi:MAG: hypothetical protein PWR13_998 [Archaeoglobi archaeon]|nr:hypothetical protein [Archaeoglobi archaeon]